MTGRGMLVDYMASYGWLFLFLMGIIAALFTTGLFSFGLVSTMSCKVPPGFGCKNPFIGPGEVRLEIVNHHALPLDIHTVELTSPPCSQEVSFNKTRLDRSESLEVVFRCGYFGRVVEGPLTIHYSTSHASLVHAAEGRISFTLPRKFSLPFT